MIDIKLPQLGETVTEATVTRWYKKVGDQVRRDEPLCEVSTDKVDTEIPSPEDGVLTEIVVAEGQTAATLAVIARVQASSTVQPEPVASAPQPSAAQPTAPAAQPVPSVPPAVPAPVAPVAPVVAVEVPQPAVQEPSPAPSVAPEPVSPAVSPTTVGPVHAAVPVANPSAMSPTSPAAVSAHHAVAPAAQAVGAPGSVAAAVVVEVDVTSLAAVLTVFSLDEIVAVAASRVAAEMRREVREMAPTSVSLAVAVSGCTELSVRVADVDLLRLPAAVAAIRAAADRARARAVSPSDVAPPTVAVFSAPSAKMVFPAAHGTMATIGVAASSRAAVDRGGIWLAADTVCVTVVAGTATIATAVGQRLAGLLTSYNWSTELTSHR